MESNSRQYYIAAREYIHCYYQKNVDETLCFGWHLIEQLMAEGDKVARSIGLEGIDYSNAMLITCFRFAGVSRFVQQEETWCKLLNDFGRQVSYPSIHVRLVEQSIRNHSNFLRPSNQVEAVAWDAINSRLAADDFVAYLSLIKKDLSRSPSGRLSQLEMLEEFEKQFERWGYFTEYGRMHYLKRNECNYLKLKKRILKLEEKEVILTKEYNKLTDNLSSKETEELFKTAFRNYAHLISVADSKAGLLIHVNSIIISVVIGFVASKADKFAYLLVPSFMLLSVAFFTICLSILASRPQPGNRIHDKKSSTYQTFFFGSFDMIGRQFLKADWNNYSNELSHFLKSDKRVVLQELYKETYNVRKVLSKKFLYLSIAYWVFLLGLFISIVVFFFKTYRVH